MRAYLREVVYPWKMELLLILERAGIETKNGIIDLPKTCKRVKIDVGLSGDASQSATWLDSDPDLIVFGFEPVRYNLDQLYNSVNQRIHKYLGNRFFVIPVALGAEEGTFPIYVTAIDSGRSSLLKPISFEISTIEDVRQFTLSQFLDHFPFDSIDRIDYLKTDCQGSDLEVITGAEKYLHRIAVITAECENNEYVQSNNSFERVNEFLNKHNFVCVNGNRFQTDELKPKMLRVYSGLKSHIPISIKDFLKSRLTKQALTQDPTFFNNKYLELINNKQLLTSKMVR